MFYLDEKLLVALDLNSRKLIQHRCEERLSRDPSDSLSLIALCGERIHQGRYEEARALGERVVAKGGELAGVGFLLLSFCYQYEARLSKALDAIRRSLELLPENITVLEQTALLYLLHKNNSLAHRYAGDVLERQPESLMCLNIRALTAHRLNIDVPSKEELDSILTLDPYFHLSYYFRGLIERESGKASRSWFEKALSLSPECEWSQAAFEQSSTQ